VYFYSIWIIVLSVLTLSLYGIDKAQSKRKGARVPEKTLHLLALAGGFLGGWAGRYVFHHKTNKGIFIFVLILSTVIHLVLVYFLFFGSWEIKSP
jgi:uncharacterized membrane protein YsdA (DUF1294 family)